MTRAEESSSSADAARPSVQARRIPAIAKVPCAVAVISAMAAVPLRHVGWLTIVLPFLAVYIVWSRVSLRTLLRRLALSEPIVLAASLLMLLRPDGGMLFAAVVWKATLCILAAQLLVLTTPFQDIVGVLRRMRLPAPLIGTLSLLYRYVPVLSEETLRMRRARAARSFGRSRHLPWRMLASILGLLFVRSMGRAERIEAAMRSRGWS